MFDPGRRRSPSGIRRLPGLARGRLAQPAMVVIVCWTAISSCSGAPGTSSLPPASDRVGVSSSLEPFALGKMRAYTQSVGDPGFDLEVVSVAEATQAAQAGRLQLLVSPAPPPNGWFATPLGVEAIAIIVNPMIRTRNLSLHQLADVFSGTAQSWEEIDGEEQPIQLVIPPDGDDLRRQFEALVINGRPFPRTAMLAPTPAAMVRLVGQTAGAIGFLPLSYAAEGARTISIDGQAPSPSNVTAGTYPLGFEVIGTAPDEPRGGVRGWLAWLQEQE